MIFLMLLSTQSKSPLAEGRELKYIIVAVNLCFFCRPSRRGVN